MADIVRIYCDIAPRHPVRKPEVPVNTFISIGDGRWTSRNSSPWLQRQHRASSSGGSGVGTTLAGDQRYDRKAHRGRDDLRSVYDLECLKCGLFSVSLTEPRLFAELNGLRDAGRSEIPLRVFAAIVGGTAKA